MPRTSPAQTNFTAGEISPQLYGRIDLQKYQNGCRTLKNFISRVHGGAERRPGTYFVAEVKSSSKATRLIPFEFSVTQAYVIEVGDQYMRFYMDYGQIVTSGTTPYEIATPYLEADIWGLRFIQDADIMYIVHPSYAPRKLSRTGHTSWSLDLWTFIDGPYLDQNDTARTMAPSATTGSINIVTAGVSPADFFNSGHVGQFIRIKHSSTWGYARIDSITSATQVAATVLSAFGDTAAVTEWRLGAFSPGEGYPSVIAFHEQRMILGATPNSPQTIWATKTGTDDDFTPEETVTDAGPYTYEIKSERSQYLRWMSAMTNLMIGTVAGEWRLGAQDTTSPITPSNAKVTQQGRQGSMDLQALNMGGTILFVERRGLPENYGEKVRELSYDYLKDRYEGIDLTLLAEHITAGGIVDWDFQQAPNPIIWAVRADGVLLGLTYERGESVIGWHRHETEGSVESVCVIPGDYQDDVWLIVNRTIGGSTKRYVEYMMPFKWGGDQSDQADCFFVDCGLSYYGGSAVDITGATQANPCVITAPGHGLSEGQHVRIKDVEGMTELNNHVFTVTNPTSSTFELSGVDSSTYKAYTSGGYLEVVVNQVSGLSHLANEDVVALVDGASYDDLTVASDGSVDLPAQVYGNKIHVGLAYESELETLDFEGGTVEGPRAGKRAHISNCRIRFYKSLGGSIGQGSRTDEIDFRKTSDVLGSPPALYSGIWSPNSFPSSGWDREPRVKIITSDPLPMTILSIMPTFRAEDI